MDVALDPRGKNARFAVIRNYQPARIERELLAQVFDIVQRSAGKQHAEPPTGRSTTHVLDADSSEHTCDRIALNQYIELEPDA